MEGFDEEAGFCDPFDDFIVNNQDSSENHNHLELQDASEVLVPYQQPSDSFEFPEPVIQNVIASVNLSTKLDLRLIAISARNAEYNPTKVNAVVSVC